jgi:putative nucleotidyltransferase with HDIG domain
VARSPTAPGRTVPLRAVDREVVRRVVAAMPGHPRRALEVLRLLDDPRSSARELAKVVEADDELSNRVLRLANSPFFGLDRPVERARHAVVLLGFGTVRALAASSAMAMILDQRRGGPPGFWAHAATAASSTAVMARHAGVDPADAFAAGMLHDIGLALLYRIDDPLEAMVADAVAGGGDLIAEERKMFGVSHAEVGAMALEEWGYPFEVATAVLEHHLADRPDPRGASAPDEIPEAEETNGVDGDDGLVGPPAVPVAASMTQVLRAGLALAEMVEPNRLGERTPPTSAFEVATGKPRLVLLDEVHEDLRSMTGFLVSQSGHSLIVD